MKRERVIITPPFIDKTFWVEKNNISPTYLEQFGYFLGQLLLGKSFDRATGMIDKYPALVKLFKLESEGESKVVANNNFQITEEAFWMKRGDQR